MIKKKDHEKQNIEADVLTEEMIAAMKQRYETESLEKDDNPIFDEDYDIEASIYSVIDEKEPILFKRRGKDTVRDERKTQKDIIAHRQQELFEEASEKKAKEIQTQVENKKSKRKTILQIVFLVAITAITVGILLGISNSSGAGTAPLSEVFERINWDYILIALGCLLLVILSESLQFAYINKVQTKRFRPLLSAKVASLGKFFDNITPFAIGGQPFQIHNLIKGGVSPAKASSAVILKYFFKSFVEVICVITIMVVNRNALTGQSPIVMVLCIVGIVFQCVVPTFLLCASISRRFAFKIARGVLKIGKKFKIVKNYEKTLEKLNTMVDEFHVSIRMITTNVLHIFAILFIVLVGTLAFYVIPYFVAVSFGYSATWDGMLVIVTICLYSQFAAAIAPTPGASGAAEGIVYAALAVCVEAGYIFWTVIFWRIITYYSFIIIGFIISLFGTIKSIVVDKRKMKKLKKGMKDTDVNIYGRETKESIEKAIDKEKK